MLISDQAKDLVKHLVKGGVYIRDLEKIDCKWVEKSSTWRFMWKGGEGGGRGWGRCKKHIKHMFLDLMQFVRGFLYWKDHVKKKKKKRNGHVLNKPQMRLLLKTPRGTFHQIETKTYLASFTCPILLILSPIEAGPNFNWYWVINVGFIVVLWHYRHCRDRSSGRFLYSNPPTLLSYVAFYNGSQNILWRSVFVIH